LKRFVTSEYYPFVLHCNRASHLGSFRIGGPNATVTTPNGLYFTTQRYALVTFQTDPVIQKTGFQFVYESVFTANPCNRDIVLMLSGLSTVGTQENFQKQLDFVANQLSPTWQVGLDKIRVVLNLVVSGLSVALLAILFSNLFSLYCMRQHLMRRQNRDVLREEISANKEKSLHFLLGKVV
ncbi:hypothetical protein COOONC_25254, partial [Cooperia oncophora]